MKEEAAAAMRTAGEDEISAAGRRRLLDLARRAIESAVRGHPAPELAPVAAGEDELQCHRGAFVTLTSKDGALRGCVGVPQPVYRVDEAVAHAAVAAALHDRRFDPVGLAELGDLGVHVSVLGPLRATSPERVEVGVHGLVVRHAGRSGLLLPQVAVEQGWDRARFLEETCRKAGLPAGTWRDPACELLAFTATVFSDDE